MGAPVTRALIPWGALAGVGALAAAGAVWRAPPAPVVLAIFFLPHLYALVALLAFALWMSASQSRSQLWALTAVVTVGALLWGRAWSATPDLRAGAPLRVMSWNVHRLWGGPDARDPGACVAAVVRGAAPDVLLLQEVSADDVSRLRSELGVRCAQSDYLGTGRPRSGGVAVCAASPRVGWHGGQSMPYSDLSNWRYVAAELSVGGRTVNALSVHLSPYGVGAKRFRRELGEAARGESSAIARLGAEGERIFEVQGEQANGLLGRIGRFRDPTLVGGDFNSTRDTALHTALRGLLADTWEQGGAGFGTTARLFGWVPLRVDYVYASRSLPVRRTQVLASTCSDHLPVLADMSIPPL